MLKGYTKATKENLKVGAKVYIIPNPVYMILDKCEREIHHFEMNTFGKIVAINKSDGTIEVKGRLKGEMYGRTPLYQSVYGGSLLVKEVK